MSQRAQTPSRKAGPAADYRPLTGVPDELMSPTGTIRPVWLRFLDYFSGLGADDIARRFARGDEYLRDAGVFFRQYGSSEPSDRSGDRAWPLSHVPVLIHDNEWAGISAALVQRAELLEAIVADLYGSNTLVADGHLPASLVAGNPEWLRPMVGVHPVSGYYLNFVAFDIGRGPQGRWWVLEDRTQAPSGAGFALENRVATGRVFADFYNDANVHRVAGFFRAFRDSLDAMRTDDGGIAILTPGPLNDTYFEHAYIARYLGMTLLEGEDLTVENGRVMVRTVSGNRPISVLWRRLDAAFADPLELNGASRLGTSGLVGAIRSGRLSMVNALGSGVLESKALFAFMPSLCSALRQESLEMPNVATWWCGSTAERDYVAANAEHMVISPAVPGIFPIDSSSDGRSTNLFGLPAGASMKDALSSNDIGAHFVGQEAVTLSTTPTYAGGRLVPRPMSLRVFLARTSNGWEVMPGGFARIGRSDDPTAIAMQRGGSVADVWIVSDAPVKPVTLLPSSTVPYTRPSPGSVPTRAADNLFWLGRYVERAEGTLRLMRAYFVRLAESGGQETPLLKNTAEYLDMLGVDPRQAVPKALLRNLSAAIGSAGKVRDRFSIDGWMALNDLNKSANRIAKTSTLGDDSARAMGVLLRKITGFSGLVNENMYRFTGWRFLTIGRSLERAVNMASLLAYFADEDAPEGALDLVIEVGDSVLTHRRRYTVNTSRDTVVDLLGLDSMNPRSIIYHLAAIRDEVDRLPGAVSNGQMSALAREVLRLHTGVTVMTPESFDSDRLLECYNDLAGLSELLTETYLT